MPPVLCTGSQIPRMARGSAAPTLPVCSVAGHLPAPWGQREKPGRTEPMTAVPFAEPAAPRTDWVALARELGPGFAARAAALDANDSFPFDNYQELKDHAVFAAGVPAELGGGGASHAELCALLRELGRSCGATALALSMHLHLVAAQVWLWQQGAPVAPLLQRIAAEQLVLVTTSASGWLGSNGTAQRVDRGQR